MQNPGARIQNVTRLLFRFAASHVGWVESCRLGRGTKPSISRLFQVPDPSSISVSSVPL